ncbi:hypothetical protein AVEN_124112-1 [Araneus ventricosus]|uniref:Uncharacterized protein n=1 Tax=Araneus ventricosus TaxID=182803 RepID=A0A4Y2HQL5_ARAVE|nr:hypothetical protein AVEN_251228-1 [Araneus ventricosus]GBO35685.1 hypothetical protein AVEN_124112-1 [Araneus ventricosus]
MHSVIDCFHSNQPNLSILFFSSRRNLSATKHGRSHRQDDLLPCQSNILSLSPPPSHQKHLSFNLERGVRIRTGSPNLYWETKSVGGVRVLIQVLIRGRAGSPSTKRRTDTFLLVGLESCCSF